MLPNGITGTGISARKRCDDLDEFAYELDATEGLGVETIELPLFDMDVVAGGRVRQSELAKLRRACAGRSVTFTVHGPLAINFMDEAWRLPRHFEVLKASLDAASEVKCFNYVVHAGVTQLQHSIGIQDAYARQREWLAKGGEVARTYGIALCVETLFTDNAAKHTPTPARLARELSAIGHPNVMATIDFSHSYLRLDLEGRRADFLEEVASLAPHARHLHVHDSFGLQDDMWMFAEGERFAFGHGDLHLPVGWGDIPWNDLMRVCEFAPGVVFNVELRDRYWYAVEECVNANKAIAAKARTSLLAEVA